ncbi:uncharacterized protein METZ01_LOCUS281265, partial [marine metagenome]
GSTLRMKRSVPIPATTTKPTKHAKIIIIVMTYAFLLIVYK